MLILTNKPQTNKRNHTWSAHTFIMADYALVAPIGQNKN